MSEDKSKAMNTTDSSEDAWNSQQDALPSESVGQEPSDVVQELQKADNTEELAKEAPAPAPARMPEVDAMPEADAPEATNAAPVASTAKADGATGPGTPTESAAPRPAPTRITDPRSDAPTNGAAPRPATPAESAAPRPATQAESTAPKAATSAESTAPRPETKPKPDAPKNGTTPRPKPSAPAARTSTALAKGAPSTALAKVPKGKGSTLAKVDKDRANGQRPQQRRRPPERRPQPGNGKPGSGKAAAAKPEGAPKAAGRPTPKRPRPGAGSPNGGKAPQKPAAKHASPAGAAGPKGKKGGPKGKPSTAVPKKPAAPETPTKGTAAQVGTVLASAAHKVAKLPSTCVEAVGQLRKDPKAFLQQSKRAVVIAVLVVVYLVGSLFFMSHYLPGTTIDNQGASWMSLGKLVDRTEQAAKDFTTNVSGDGINTTINGTEITFEFDRDAYRQEASKHLPGFLWPVRLLTARDYHIESGVSFSQDLLNERMESVVSIANEDAKEPQNATLSYDAQQKAFVLVEQKAGTAVSLEHATATVSRGIHDLRRSITLTEDDLVQPTVTIDHSEVEKSLARANQMTSLSIPLLVQGEKVAEVDQEHIRSWVTLDDEGKVTGDLEKITDWTQGDLSAKVDTVGIYRVFTRPDGTKVTVVGGTYGWNIDGKELARIIQSRIAGNSNEPIEIPMLDSAAVYNHGGQDWGKRYIDVDLGAQYVRMYDSTGSLIWESDCVTGNTAESNDTVTGVFTIEGKESPAKLIGLDYDLDGEPDYETDVEYWMPFYGGYGFHDALWRDYFGDDVYQYDGSHGCVNLPYYKAQSLYEFVRIGDVVVVHD